MAESEAVTRPIGDLLRAYIGQAGLTQASFARAIHANPAQVNKWITGVMRPSPENVVRIATFFEVDPQPLLRIAGYLPERYVGTPVALDVEPLQMDGERANELSAYSQVLDDVPREYWQELRGAVRNLQQAFNRFERLGSAQRSVASGQQ